MRAGGGLTVVNLGAVSLSAEGTDAARKVLEASTIDGSVPRPRLGDWWQELMGRTLAYIAQLLNLDSALVKSVIMSAAWLVIGVTALALIWFVWSWVKARDTVSEGAAYTRVRTQTTRHQGDEQQWSQRLDAALAQRNVAAALEALWFVVAARLAGRSTDPKNTAQLHTLVAGREWTGRRLLAAAGALRSSLTPRVRALERYTYGKGETTLEDVLELRSGFDQVLSRSVTADSGGSR